VPPEVPMTTPVTDRLPDVPGLDRRVAVAPMMDCTDAAKTFFSIKCLHAVQNACLLYVSSEQVSASRRLL
jgi:hypothetical protein